jgi:hypothetical protein
MKKYITASVLSLGLAMTAQAATFTPTHSVYITGSTAMRSEIWGTLTNNITPPPTNDLNSTFTFGGPSSTSFTVQGTWAGGGTIIVYCGFSGSAAGIGTLVGDPADQTPPYVDITGNTVVHSGADLAFSDVQQATTIYSSSPTTLNDLQVAVVPFVFAKNSDPKSAGITNITYQNFNQMAAGGSQSLAVWTGNASDSSTLVYLTGRDTNSGTRLTILAETGYGTTTGVQQYHVVANVWTAWPANGGQSSGKGVYGDITNTATGSPAIGYVGLADALGDGSVLTQISFAGVPYTQANVENGPYTYWTYENLDDNNASTFAVTTFEPTFANEVQAWVDLINDTAAINPAHMNVIRNTDGGQVLH